jgi:hypothetical protein
MSSRRRTRRALRLLKACTLVLALSWHQLLAMPLMACMQMDSSEAGIDCPAHGGMHAQDSHAAHSEPSSSETRIRCAGPCESRALTVVSTSAPVPDRIGTVLASAGAVLAPVHADSNPGGLSVVPGVPPPRS